MQKLLIRLGAWVTKTEVILELIEALGGGTTLRGFNVLDNLGLSGDELDKAIENIDSLEGGIDGLVKKAEKTATVSLGGVTLGSFKATTKDQEALNEIAAVFNVSQERALEILGKLTVERGKDAENLKSLTDLLIEYKERQDENNAIVKEANDKTEKYSERLKALGEQQKKGIDIEEERNKLYDEIAAEGGPLSKINDELDEYRNKGRDLTEDELRRVKLLEVMQSTLNGVLTSTINLREGTEELAAAEEKQLETFRKNLRPKGSTGRGPKNG